MPGIINSVNVVEGQEVWRGTVLVNLASNYTGGNALGVQAQLASLQYQNIKDTYDVQKEIIANRREIVNKTDENADELRAIVDRSISETNDVINLNNQVISGLQIALDAAIANGNQQETSTFRPLLVQAKSANLQLNQASRSAQFQASADKPPAQLSNLGREVALKQLEIQEKALDLSLEASRLQKALAYIAASAMAPASPFAGVVERVHVLPGQFVNPGTPIATISSSDQRASVIVKVPQRIAENVSKLETSVLFISGKTYKIVPEYISSEATDGLLYSIIIALPDEAVGKITDRDFIQVTMPIGYPDSIGTIPYLPIDIIFQTQEGAFVYVVENKKVKSKKVNLGDVVGSNVAIESGLAQQELVILDRNVIEGESVEITN